MIPVSFDYQGKHYKGYFKPVSGAAANLWHLMIEGHYKGQLWTTEGEWRFSNNQGTFTELTDYFAGVVMAWYG